MGARTQFFPDLEAKNSELWVLILEAHYPGLWPPVGLALGSYCNASHD